MAHSTLWWLLTGVLVAVELATGTFYLLMLAVGAAAGAVAAHAGMGETGQIAVAAVVATITVLAWHLYKRRHPTSNLPAGSNRDVNLDVGEAVQVDTWQPDGTATVRYRGAQWTAVHRAGVIPAPGPHRVGEVIGSRLVLDRV